MPFEPGTRVRVIDDARIFPELPFYARGSRSHYAGLEGVVVAGKFAQWEVLVDFHGTGHGVGMMEYELIALPPVQYEENGKSRFQSFQISVEAHDDGVPIPRDWIKDVQGTPHVRLLKSTNTTATIEATPEGLEELNRRFTLDLEGYPVQYYLTITGAAASETELV